MPRSAPFDLIPAVHTPFAADGSVDVARVLFQAQHLAAQGIGTVFVAGTTGEGLSLRTEERRALTEAWVDAAQRNALQVLVHVGSHAVDEAADLAAHAERCGAHGIAALAPSFVKPQTVHELVAVCAAIAAGAPTLPFYYYDIPALSGVALATDDWLARAAETIDNLGGVKFTNPCLRTLQACLSIAGPRFEILYGNDEALLAGLALGCRGAVGSTYNFAAPLARAVIDAFDAGDLERARSAQLRIVELVDAVARFGYLSANKRIPRMLDPQLDLGQPRLPLPPCEPETEAALRNALIELGFFDWLRKAST